jgi:two-component system, NarL family, sensor histidine kinase DesK
MTTHDSRPAKPRKYPFLPPDAEIGWMPYLWLVYLGFFTIDPIFGGASLGEWLLFAGVLALFLPLYFLGFWARTPARLLLVVGAITLLAILYLPYNLSSWGLFIYAGAYLGFGLRPGHALALLCGLCAIIVVEGLMLDLPAWIWGAAAAMTAIIGASNVHFATMQRKNAHLKAAREEVERLAQSAERERIGRDLHDLLGHTLTLIAVKAELAARLADRDPERSREEIREVHRISRHALAEVRRAVQGYRSGAAGLAHELSSARGALESAEVELETAVSEEAMEALAAGSEREAAVAFALREAVTNVLRHARARRCRVGVSLVDGGRRVRLTVEDDGRGGGGDGDGLDGMRRRVEALGGTVRRRSDSHSGKGTALTVELPVARSEAEEAATADPRPATSPAPA